jgi:hypothetical protein
MTDQPENKRKKRLLAAFLGFSVLAGGSAAYSYWTDGGTGTGSADTGTNSGITIVQTTVIDGQDLRPGAAPVTLGGTFTNPDGNGAVYVTTVTPVVASVTSAAGAGPACTPADYTVVAATGLAITVPENTTNITWSGATIKLAETGANQDRCKGQTVSLTYTSS